MLTLLIRTPDIKKWVAETSRRSFGGRFPHLLLGAKISNCRRLADFKHDFAPRNYRGR
jgi:hypothetical protein